MKTLIAASLLALSVTSTASILDDAREQCVDKNRYAIFGPLPKCDELNIGGVYTSGDNTLRLDNIMVNGVLVEGIKLHLDEDGKLVIDTVNIR